MSRRLFAVLAFAFVPILLLTACGSGSNGTGGSKSIRAALVLPGPLGDKGFFDSAAGGLQRMHDQLGAQTKVLQSDSKNPSDWLQNLQSVSGQNYDLVITGAQPMRDNLSQVAKASPNQKFLYFDDVVKQPNVASIVYKQNEGSFLAGVLAGQVTTDSKAFPLSKKSKKIGFVGGMDIRLINDFLVGFKTGVATIDPGIEVMTSYTGTFSDPQKGFAQAQTMFDQGADLVYAVAGRSGLGVLKAAQGANRYSIGVDSNQNGLYPGHVLASVVKHVDNSLFDLANNYKQGSLVTGKTYTYGLSNNGIGLVLDQKDVPSSVAGKIDLAQAKVANGQIKVPSALPS
jgi:basic membrane protein A